MSAEFVFKATMKAEEGTEDTPFPFVGIASSTRLDRESERFTDKALESMASQVPIALTIGDHKQAVVDVMAEAGTIDTVKADEGKLLIGGSLDPDHPNSEYLYKKIKSGKAKLSVAGNVTKARKNVWDPDLQKHVHEIDELTLDHVLLCRPGAAINQDTAIVAQADTDWADAVFKAAAEVAQDAGPGGECVCPDCGKTVPHETGEPCYGMGCPDCGATMARKATKADLPEGMSYEDLRDAVLDAVDEKHPGAYPWIVELFSDACIVEVGDKYFRYPYSIEGEGVSLGEGEEVKQEWVAASIAVNTPSEVDDFSTRVGEALALMSKAGGDRAAWSERLQILVEDLAKANEPCELPVDKGTRSMSDIVDTLVSAVDRLTAVSKSEEPTEDPAASAETSAEQKPEEQPEAEAEKADTMDPEVVGLLQKMSEALKSVDERLDNLEKTKEPTEKEIGEEEPEAENAEGEEEVETEGAAEEPEVEEFDTRKAFSLVAKAIEEIREKLNEMDMVQESQAAELAEIAKASPVSAQAKPDHTNPVENGAGYSDSPIQNFLMG